MLRGAVDWCVLELMRMYSVSISVGVGGVWKEWTGFGFVVRLFARYDFFG